MSCALRANSHAAFGGGFPLSEDRRRYPENADQYVRDRRKGGTAALLLCAACAAAALLVLFYFFGLRGLPRVDMSAQLDTEHLRTGSDGAEAGALRLYGDHLRCTATLHPLDRIDDAVLCFRAEGAPVTVRIGGQERAMQGGETQGDPLAGARIFVLPLLDEDWGKTLEIEIGPSGGAAAAALWDAAVLRRSDGRLYPLIGREAKFALLVFVFVLGLLLLAASFFFAELRRRSPTAQILAVFLLAGSLYVLGRSGLLGLFIREEGLAGPVGTAASFAAPAAFFGYLGTAGMAIKKLRKWIYLLLALAFAGGGVCVAALGIAGGAPLSSARLCLELLVIGSAAVAFFMELFGGPAPARNEDGPIKAAVLAGFWPLLLSFVQRHLWRFPQAERFGSYIPDIDYMAIALLLLSGLLFLHLAKRTEAASLGRARARIIEQLTYRDILTGIPNRHHCDRMLAGIAADGDGRKTPVDYTLFFIDVNSLRRTNEAIGYEGGDELLRLVAAAVADAMRGCGADESGGRVPLPGGALSGGCFFGRWGGDEFMACTLRSESDAFETTLASRIAAINIEKRISAEVSVSFGSCDLISGSYEGVRDAIETAERAMQERKRLYYSAHSTR